MYANVVIAWSITSLSYLIMAFLNVLSYGLSLYGWPHYFIFLSSYVSALPPFLGFTGMLPWLLLLQSIPYLICIVFWIPINPLRLMLHLIMEVENLGVVGIPWADRYGYRLRSSVNYYVNPSPSYTESIIAYPSTPLASAVVHHHPSIPLID